jgi:hypothetical protein
MRGPTLNPFVRTLGRVLVALALAALLGVRAGAAQPDPDLSLEPARVAPPPLQVNGAANPDYARDLEARLQSVPEADRKLFFKLLRRQQRSLDRYLEEMTFNYERAKSLHTALKGEDQTPAARAADLMDAQRESILQYRVLARAIERLRKREDPMKVDALDFQADLYAGFEFDNLYQDQDSNSNSFFSKSLPFVSLDLRNIFRWPEGEKWLETFGTLSFQSASKETSDTVSVITTTGNFKGEMGAWMMRPVTESVSWGVLGSAGLVGYTAQESTADLSAADRDHFRSTYLLGLTLRQEAGPMRNSVAEVAYERDPLFVHLDRLVVLGKVVLTQFGSSGANGDFYIEGWASKGRVGRDEAVLLLGIRLSTLSFLRSLGGGGLPAN